MNLRRINSVTLNIWIISFKIPIKARLIENWGKCKYTQYTWRQTYYQFRKNNVPDKEKNLYNSIFLWIEMWYCCAQDETPQKEHYRNPVKSRMQKIGWFSANAHSPASLNLKASIHNSEQWGELPYFIWGWQKYRQKNPSQVYLGSRGLVFLRTVYGLLWHTLFLL